jgi:hypothetical protein
MTWRTFMRAHWPVLLAADFFTTEVWTFRGLMTYYTAFIIELHSRRVHVLGSTRHPNDAFVVQAFRELAIDGDVLAGRFLICDRDPKWSRAMEALLRTVGVRVVRAPAAAPNCDAHAERFVRSIKTECLDRVVPVGEWHLRRLVREFVDHYHGERNHQGIGNELIERSVVRRASGPVRRRQRAGGILSYYYGRPRRHGPSECGTLRVQQIVRTANTYRIPLYPISTGKNLGYGGSAPNLTGSVVVNLKRMNRILEVDDTRHYAPSSPASRISICIATSRSGSSRCGSDSSRRNGQLSREPGRDQRHAEFRLHGWRR